MAKKTKAEIMNVISEMDANNEKITVRSVREKVGGGSLGDIAPIVKEYQAGHSVESAPERVYETLAGVADRLWADAMKLAKETWAGERLDFQNQIDDLEAELEEARETISQGAKVAAERNEQIEDLKNEKSDMADRVEAIRVESNEKVAEMQDKLAASQSAAAVAQAELKAAKEQVAMLQGMLDKFQPEKKK